MRRSALPLRQRVTHRSQWVPEVKHFCPHVPFVLVACKKDLRTDPTVIAELKKNGQAPVTTAQGQQMATNIVVRVALWTVH